MTMTMPRTISQAEETAQATSLTTGVLSPTERSLIVMPTYDFATVLKASGHDVGPEYNKVTAILDALTAARLVNAHDLDSLGDPLAIDPDAAVAHVRAATLNHLAARLGNDLEQGLRRTLERSFAVAFRTHSDSIVTGMQAEFDQALAAITAAHKAGLTPSTTRDALLDRGTAEQLDAYRRVAPAAATLNRIADLRIRMCNTAGIGPTTHPIACLVDSPDQFSLEGAANIYTGTTETVLVTASHPAAGPSARRIPSQRLGGPWLALVAAGHKVRLNTAAEADATAARPNPKTK